MLNVIFSIVDSRYYTDCPLTAEFAGKKEPNKCQSYYVNQIRQHQNAFEDLALTAIVAMLECIYGKSKSPERNNVTIPLLMVKRYMCIVQPISIV